MDLEFVWSAGYPKGHYFYPLKNGIFTDNPSPVPRDRCGLMRHRSVLTFKVRSLVRDHNVRSTLHNNYINQLKFI